MSQLMKPSNNKIIIKPFIYGTVAVYIGNKPQSNPQNNCTHKWCVYVRGVNNEDISNFIKEVEFTLHNSFQNNIRRVTKWPFELQESGWGEFDIRVRIFLIDEKEKPIDLQVPLKFYTTANRTPSKKPVVNELYDEIVFVNPKPDILEMLMKEPEVKINFENKKDDKNNDKLNASINTGTAMEVEEEKKVENNNNDILEENNNDAIDIEKADNKQEDDKGIIENVSKYFGVVDDSAQVKELETINLFVMREIEKLKNELEYRDKQIKELNKEIKEKK